MALCSRLSSAVTSWSRLPRIASPFAPLVVRLTCRCSARCRLRSSAVATTSSTSTMPTVASWVPCTRESCTICVTSWVSRTASPWILPANRCTASVAGGLLGGLGQQRDGADGRLEFVGGVRHEVPCGRLHAQGRGAVVRDDQDDAAVVQLHHPDGQALARASRTRLVEVDRGGLVGAPDLPAPGRAARGSRPARPGPARRRWPVRWPR